MNLLLWFLFVFCCISFGEYIQWLKENFNHIIYISLFRVTSFLSGILANYIVDILWHLVICMWISLFWYCMSSLREEIMACSLLLALTRREEALKHRLWENKYCESFWPVMSFVLGETQKTAKNGQTRFLIFCRNTAAHSSCIWKTLQSIILPSSSFWELL